MIALSNISYELAGGIATIMINRPERRNALDKATYMEIQAALDAANEDPEVGVVVLTGAGEQAFALVEEARRAITMRPRMRRVIDEFVID